MSTPNRCLAALASLLLLSLACQLVSPSTPPPPADQPTGTTAPPAAVTQPPAQATQPLVIDPGDCLAAIPVYPGALPAPDIQAELQDWVDNMQTLANADDGLVSAYTTPDRAGDVAEWYRAHPPTGAWTRTLALTSRQEGGLLAWERGPLSAQVFTGDHQGQTVILLGCGTRLGGEPQAAVKVTDPLSLYDAMQLLRRETGLPGLAFYNYQARGLDAQGRSQVFTISGFDPAAKKFCYLRAEDNGLLEQQCRSQDTLDEPLVPDLAALKDSPALVQEALAANAACQKDLRLEINLAQTKAELRCSDPRWVFETTPYQNP